MTNELNYVRGAFIAYEPDGYPKEKRVIPFRFNPEAISRTVAVETGQTGGGVEGAAAGAAAAPAGETRADASAGSLKESFSIQIRLDFADRGQQAGTIDDQYGVAPEIAAIEDLLYPAPTKSEATSDGAQPTHPARPRPTVLFVWGSKRVLPVRIASLKIDESVFNTELHPVRAEIEASLEVLGEAEAKNHGGVKAALTHTGNARRELARMYYERTAGEGSILPF